MWNTTLDSLCNGGGGGRKNVASKMIQWIRVLSNSNLLYLSNVSEFYWSWIFGNRTQIKKVEQNNSLPCVYVIDKMLDFRTSRRSLSENKKEVCQKCNARAELFVVLIKPIVFLTFPLASPSSLLKLPLVTDGTNDTHHCSLVYIVKQGAGCRWNWFWGEYWVIFWRNITA